MGQKEYKEIQNKPKCPECGKAGKHEKAGSTGSEIDDGILFTVRYCGNCNISYRVERNWEVKYHT